LETKGPHLPPEDPPPAVRRERAPREDSPPELKPNRASGGKSAEPLVPYPSQVDVIWYRRTLVFLLDSIRYHSDHTEQDE
jgi:hypothetical protein